MTSSPRRSIPTNCWQCCTDGSSLNCAESSSPTVCVWVPLLLRCLHYANAWTDPCWLLVARAPKNKTLTCALLKRSAAELRHAFLRCPCDANLWLSAIARISCHVTHRLSGSRGPIAALVDLKEQRISGTGYAIYRRFFGPHSLRGHLTANPWKPLPRRIRRPLVLVAPAAVR